MKHSNVSYHALHRYEVDFNNLNKLLFFFTSEIVGSLISKQYN